MAFSEHNMRKLNSEGRRGAAGTSAHLLCLTAACPDDYDICKCGIANPALPPVEHPAAIHLHQILLSLNAIAGMALHDQMPHANRISEHWQVLTASVRECTGSQTRLASGRLQRRGVRAVGGLCEAPGAYQLQRSHARQQLLLLLFRGQQTCR